MPTYEYECKECRHHFEAFQSMSDKPLDECPKCGSEARRLIFGGAGVIFKGSGFYVTDRKGASSAACGASSAAPADKAAACAQCPAASASSESQKSALAASA